MTVYACCSTVQAIAIRLHPDRNIFEAIQGRAWSQVKLWDVALEQPALLAASDVGVGALFSAAFCAEAPFLVAAGGAKVPPPPPLSHPRRCLLV